MVLINLGNCIEQLEMRNHDNIFGAESVVGISTQKEIIKTKADLNGVSLTSYKLFPPMSFAYVPDTSRRGDKISLTFNHSKETFLVSSISVVFKVKNIEVLSPEYLFMIFNRPEFDRFARFNSWGSARETFSWKDFCDIELNLPPLSIQQKYVDAYQALLANQKSYEEGLDDLKLTCDAYIEELRRKIPSENIGKYITQINERNHEKSLTSVMGLSTKKVFREAQSRVDRKKLENYKIVKPREFAFVPTTDTWKVLAFGLNNLGKEIVVSPIYEVFRVDESRLAPKYLAMWLSRKEFDRYARFHSWGSARENFSFDDMCDVKIPIPDIKTQKAISDIYAVYTERRAINERLKERIKKICPILIKGSLDEGERCRE